MQVYRGLLRGVQVVAVKVFNDGPQYTSDSSEERLQTLHALKSQRQTLIKQEIAVLKSCRDRNIVQFVGACIHVRSSNLAPWQMTTFCPTEINVLIPMVLQLSTVKPTICFCG